MCETRLFLKHRNYQALKNSFGNEKMCLPGGKIRWRTCHLLVQRVVLSLSVYALKAAEDDANM